MWIRKLILITILLLIKSDYVEKYYTIEKEYNTPNIKVLIKKWSIIYDLDEALMLSICDYESNFDSHMVNSKSTSRGLFGFLEPTTVWVGNMAGYKEINHYNLPVETQVELASLYVYYLKNKYHGNIKAILHEYCNEKTYYKEIMKRKIKYKETINDKL